MFFYHSQFCRSGARPRHNREAWFQSMICGFPATMTSQPREAGARQASLSHTLVWASSQRGHLRVVVVLLWGNSKASRRKGGSYEDSDDLA